MAYSTNQHTPIWNSIKATILGLFFQMLFYCPNLLAQTDSVFWFAAPEVTYQHTSEPIIYLRLTAGADGANATISKPADPSWTPLVVSIAPNAMETVNLSSYTTDNNAWECRPPNQVLDKGILIESSNLITAYYEVGGNYTNTDIFSMKGSNALGTEFYIPAQDEYPNHTTYNDPNYGAYSSFDIIATEDSTTVTIYNTSEIVGHAPGSTFSIILNRGECYSARALRQGAVDHLGGSHVTSDKPIAITIKDDSVDEGLGWDLLGDQIIPVSMLGFEYITVEGDASPGEKLYVMATEDNTNIEITDGFDVTSSMSANKGQTVRFNMDGKISAFIKADKPVYVYQMTGFNREIGAAVLPPVACTGSEKVSFRRATAETFYVIVFTRANQIDDFTLNGSSTLLQASDFNVVRENGADGTWYFAKKSFSTADVAVDAQSTISNSTGLFHFGIVNAAKCGACGSVSGCLYGYFSAFSKLGDAGEDDTICNKATASLVATYDAFYAYSWNTGSTSNVLAPSPTVTTTYTVTINDGLGCTLSDEAVVLVNQLPVAIATGDDFCLGQDTATLMGDGAGLGGSYIWSNGATTQDIQVTPLISSTYTLIVVDVNGCQDDTMAVASVNIPPTALAGDDSLCLGQSTATLTGSGTGGVFYSWSSGDSTQDITVNPASTTSYTLTVTDTNGCTDDDIGVVTVNLLPTATASSDSLCPGQSSATLKGDGAGASGTFTWSVGESTQNITVSPLSTATYTLTVTDTHGCTDEDFGVATVNPLPTATADSDSLCPGQTSATLKGNGAGVGGSYSWTTGESNQNITVSPANSTTYTLTVTNMNGCTDTVTAIATANPLPLAAAGDSSICFGEPGTLTGAGGGTYEWNTGDTNQQLVISPASTATYTLTVTNSDGCTDADTGVMTVHPNPIANAGGDVTICASGNTDLTAFGTDSTGHYLWSTLETTASINVGPPADSMFTVTVTTAAGCSDTDEILVSVGTALTPSINGTDSVCIGASTILTASGGNTYKWNTGDSLTSGILVKPLSDSIYIVTAYDASGCSGTDDIQVRVNPLPTAVINNYQDSSICPGQVIVMRATGGASYKWSSGETADTILVAPLTNTNYTVTATNVSGCTGSDEIVITMDILPTTDAGADSSICPGQSMAIWATGGTAYFWSTGETTDSILAAPLTNTSYTVTATNAAGCTDSEEIAITMDVLPIADAGSDTAVCLGETVTLSTSGHTTYRWNTGETAPFFSAMVTATTTYSVTVTNSSGCTDADEVTVSAKILPVTVLNAGADSSICPGQSMVIGATGGTAYFWSTGETTDSILAAPLANTSYTVTATNAAGCTGSEEIAITMDALPIADAGSDTAICLGETVTLSTSGHTTYRWNTGETAPSFSVTVTATTTYSVTVTNANGCTDADEVTVSAKILPTTVVNAGADSSICPGQSMAIGATGGTAYFWSTGETTDSILAAPLANTSYTVTATNAAGCTDSEEIAITMDALPIADAGSDTAVCMGEAVTLSVSGHTTYRWNTGETAPSLTAIVYTTTTYSVTVTNASGCTDADEVTVIANILPVAVVNARADSSICPGQIVVLRATGGTAYLWNTGETTDSVLVAPLTSTSYKVTVANIAGCSGSDEIIITMDILPTADAGADTAKCQGEPVRLSASGGSTYIWNTGETSYSITANVLVSTTYTVTAISNKGCTSTDQVTVYAYPLPAASFTMSRTSQETEKNISFINTSTRADSYDWHFGDNGSSTETNPVYAYLEDNSYDVILIAYSSEGCSDTAVAQTVYITTPTNLFIPSAFTPNNDGENDEFMVKGRMESMEIVIFNQWGLQVFRSNSQSNAWNGMYNGDEAPEGNYVYLFSGIGFNGDPLKTNGVVTLIR